MERIKERLVTSLVEVYMTKSDLEKLRATAVDLNVFFVLIIENNPSEQRLFWLIKEAVGMVPCVVDGSSAALEAMNSVSFNLIILNLQMPEIEALECAKQIRQLELEHRIKTPIIAVTAHAMSGDREKCINAGMDDYLAKPFSLALLKGMIAKWAA